MPFWRYLPLILLVGMVLGQSESPPGTRLKGIVVSNELSGPPQGNISLSAGDDASPTASDPVTGTFTFIFPKKRPGDPVHIYVKAAGYGVVNDFQLPINLPSEPDSNLVTIIVCRTAALEEMRSRFYRVKSNQTIDAHYAKQVKDLEDRHLADATKIEQLNKERNQALAAASKIAEELAKQDINSASELYKQAMQAFLAGKIQEATQLLDEEKLNHQLEAANEQEAAARAAKKQVAQEWLLKGRLLSLQFNFNDAERAYEAAILALPDDFEANYSYASFSHGLNRFRQARKGYERCLELASKDGNEANRARVLNNFANLDSDQNRTDEARQHYEEALKTYKALAQKDPDYLADVAMTLNNMGVLDSNNKNRMDEARQHYEEALRIRRELAQKNSDTYSPDVALILNNLGNLDGNQNRMNEARQHYEEALCIQRKLVLKNRETYLPNLAGTLINLGLLDKNQNRMGEAREHLEEALTIYRELAQKNPDTYVPYLAGALESLGILDRTQNRVDQAREHLEKAVEIRRGLVEKNPETYEPDLALALGNLGILDTTQNRVDEAREHFEKALKIYKELAQKNPDTYKPYVAITLCNLANLDGQQNRKNEARRHYKQALDIYQSFASRDPSLFQKEIERVKHALEGLNSNDKSPMAHVSIPLVFTTDARIGQR